MLEFSAKEKRLEELSSAGKIYRGSRRTMLWVMIRLQSDLLSSSSLFIFAHCLCISFPLQYTKILHWLFQVTFCTCRQYGLLVPGVTPVEDQQLKMYCLSKEAVQYRNIDLSMESALTTAAYFKAFDRF